MKHLKSCAAAVLALLAADAAIAQTTIRITGSTAFRSATINSIKNILTVTDSAFTGGTETSAQYATYIGTFSGQPVVIQTSWTGSVEGVRDVSESLNQNFIKASFVTATTAVSGTSTTTTNTAIYEQAIPEISMADNTQGATIYTANTLTEFPVGVIPFVWVKGRVGASHPALAAYSSVNNITNQMAKALLSGGAPISLLSGIADVSGTKVYAMGRNPLSGTRLVTFAECGYGASSDATQFQPIILGSNITGVNLTAEDTDNGFAVGNNGYSSGGTLATDLSKTVSDINGTGNAYDGVPFALMGYVGVGDAANLLKAINTTLTTDTSYVMAYNGASLGVTYSTANGGTTTWDFTAIKEGKYSLWSFAYLAYRPDLSGLALTFATSLKDNIILNVPAASGVKLADMKVTRLSEGSTIAQ
ncbi:MAG: hypothetical protein H2172_10365 [Opitutus sp.]|nr:hypothetical protein [Opitutus sp.]MCS6247695.1 hypothetical protein [Opitutus sp.]MCS6273017.1 hypothetical protein [Opitutus sp.]MCS6276754.1 hypothetical protein [Opitutus sp.]MCS6301597.1 hypothetical protein [Opitutus sp.]